MKVWNSFSSNYLTNERAKLSKQRQLLRIIQHETKTHYPSERIFLNHLPAFVISSIPIASRVIGWIPFSPSKRKPNTFWSLVRLHRANHFGFSHGQVISRKESYQILIDDANIGLINVKDEDIMVKHSVKTFGFWSIFSFGNVVWTSSGTNSSRREIKNDAVWW